MAGLPSAMAVLVGTGSVFVRLDEVAQQWQ